MENLIGARIRNHIIQSLIGEGGMGIVYKARELESQEIRAIKLMRKVHDQEAKRFLQEANIGKRLSHPNIVQIYDLGKLKEHPVFSYFMIMEYVDGKSLKTKTDLANFRIVEIFVEICKGLTFIHGSNIIHRDLKPSNILISDDGAVKISDLGVIKFTEETQFTKTGTIIGTPAYMSPEQCRDSSKVDTRSDIYSLGVMLFEMFAKRLPFLGPSDYNFIVQHSFEPPPSLQKFQPDLPPLIYEIINKMLEKDPERRCQNVAEVLETLTRISREMLDYQADKTRVPRHKESEKPTREDEKPVIVLEKISEVSPKTKGIIAKFFASIRKKNKKRGRDGPTLKPDDATRLLFTKPERLPSQSGRHKKFAPKSYPQKAIRHDPTVIEGSFQDQLRGIVGNTKRLPKLSAKIKKETRKTPQQSQEQVITEAEMVIGKSPKVSGRRKKAPEKDEQIIAESKVVIGKDGLSPKVSGRRKKDDKKKN